jgi:hypothetical protein
MRQLRRHSVAIPTAVLAPLLIVLLLVGKTNGWTNGAIGTVALVLMGIAAAIGTLATPFNRGPTAERRRRRAHDGVVRLVEVRGGVAVRRVVAAADLAALPAQSQVQPRGTDLQALLATVDPLRQLVLDGVEMRARRHARRTLLLAGPAPGATGFARAGPAGPRPEIRPRAPCRLRDTWR